MSEALQAYAIIAHTTQPDGTAVSWQFDRADGVQEAEEKLRKWSERARRDWPDMHFTLQPEET